VPCGVVAVFRLGCLSAHKNKNKLGFLLSIQKPTIHHHHQTTVIIIAHVRQ
jgi:hypothetical protein